MKKAVILAPLFLLLACLHAQVTMGGGATLGGTVTSQAVPPISISTSSLPNGVEGVAYSQTIATLSGTAPVTFSVLSGALPPGLSLNISTGVITGTPTTTGSYPFVIKVQDSSSPVQSASQSFNIPVTCTALSISTSTLPGGVVGQPYSLQVQSSGGTSSIAWSVTAGSLPFGLTLSSGGLISGTPTTVQTTNPVIQAQDSCFPTPQSASNTFSISVVNPVIITTVSIPQATEGQSYSTQFAAAGGVSPYTWTVSAGPLPAGLSLSSAGVLSGIPTSAAASSFTIQVADSGTNTTTAVFSLTVICPTFSINTTSLPNGVPGSAYSTTITSSGGAGAVTWSLVGGTLPSGFTFSSSGVLSGTTTQNGTFNLSFQAQDSCSPTAQTVIAFLTLTVVSPVTITTSPTLPAATQGQPYSVRMAASGGTLPYSWSGTPPSGLTINTAGLISGTPASSGSTAFPVQVQDAGGLTASGSFQIPVTCPAIVITSVSPLPPATVGQSYNFQFVSSGGVGPYTWSATGAPAGSGISVGGLFGGVPSGSGTSTPTISVTDSCLPTPQQTSGVFSLTTNPAVPTLTITTTSPLPAATEGLPYSVHLASTGGVGPYTWSIASGSLPAGLGLSAAGVIFGTPTATGTLAPTFKVSDSASHTATAVLSVSVNCVALSITTVSPLANGTQNSAYSQTLQSSGGTGAIAWAVTGGALPSGITLSNGGQVSGTPTVSGSFSVTVTATDSCLPTHQTSTQAFSLTISPFVPALVISTTSPLPPGTQGVAYSANMAATGGVGPYTWSKTGGALPAGLSLASGGAISGTPTTVGTATATIQVADSASHVTSGSFNTTISCVPLSISTTSPLGPGTINIAYSQQMQAQGGTGSLTWTLSSGSFPSGVTISPSGLISGTPTASGTFTPTIQVSDSCSTSQTVAQQFTLVIASQPLTIVTTSPLPMATGGQAYTVTLQGAGGTPPYTWSKTAGSLPTGLSLSSGGVISGTPSGSGTSTFTIQVADSAAHTATQVFTITLSQINQYYVAAVGGNDSNSGTSVGSPWATCNHAVATVTIGSAGAVINFIASTSLHAACSTISRGGTSTTARLSLQCTVPWINVTHCKMAGSFIVTTANNVDIGEIPYLGFEYTNPNDNTAVDLVTPCATGTGACGSGNSIHVNGNYFHDVAQNLGCPSSGMILMTNKHGVSVTDAQVNGNVVDHFGTFPNPTSNQAQGIYVSTQGGQVYNNIVTRICYAGLQYYDQGFNARIANNVFANNTVGMVLYGKNAIPNPGLNSVVNNIFDNNTQQAFNNSFAGDQGCSPGNQTLYSHNIVNGNGTNGPTSAFSSCTTVTSQLSEAAASTFVNYTGNALGDYHLKAGSIAKNGGAQGCTSGGTTPCTPSLDITGVPRPTPLSIGAYQ